MTKIRKRKERKKNSISKINPVEIKLTPVEVALDQINRQRKGGAINISGIGFQLLYACCRLLQELTTDQTDNRVRLEGVEDLDIFRPNYKEYIQVKTSISEKNAGDFWNMKVLQNFLEVYRADPKSCFRFVHNFKLSKGHLRNIEKDVFDVSSLRYWGQKFESANIDISDINLTQFFSQIHFEYTTEEKLKKDFEKQIITIFNLNAEVERQYMSALLFNSFEWSRNKETVSSDDLSMIMQSVTDSFSKSPTNDAIRYNWIKPVQFDNSLSNSDDSYFDGKAARPHHIARNLPVRRIEWEKKIDDLMKEFDVVVVKSSSGQGKSTLAWQCSKIWNDRELFVYEVSYCASLESVSALMDFVSSRLKIGQLPILVFDGLNHNVAIWGELATKLNHLPVKFIVTTREEDWYSYKPDSSKINLRIIDISLSMLEAARIFKLLKNQGRIHGSIDSWQPVWEKVETRGLLIEYVYLLTQGQMIQERVADQIKRLNKKESGASKIEILRLISIADVMNIRLRTSKLTKHVRSTIGFGSDHGEIYKQLEYEYYVRFDQEYVEGLHPVRSSHLLDELHKGVSIHDSLLNLFEIIEEQSIYDFFMLLSNLIHLEYRKELFDALALKLSTRKYSEMVYAIDGIMHIEPRKYWRINKSTFDDVFKLGALKLFVSDTFPFTKINTIKNLGDTLTGSNDGFKILEEKLTELTSFDVKYSDVYVFTKCLRGALKSRNSVTTQYEGIGFLSKWFKQLGFDFPVRLQIPENDIVGLIGDGSIEDVKEVMGFLFASDPEVYYSIISKHKPLIISKIKRETNTLTIEERGEDFFMEYLLDGDEEKANELSVYRIQTVHGILPFYKKYCTEALILPFPSDELYDAVRQNARKAMPKENLTNLFDVHINQIWSKTILDNYLAGSSYEWQTEHFKLRQVLLDFVKKSVRLFEAYVERNGARIMSSAKSLVSQSQLAIELMAVRKGYPSVSQKYFDKEPYEQQEKQISQFLVSLRNFINQLSGIIEPKSNNDRNLANLNLADAVERLPSMQRAISEISSSHVYFQLEGLEVNESEWYRRLQRIVNFYIHRAANNITKKVVLAKSAAQQWWDSIEQTKLTQIKNVLQNFEDESSFKFHAPKKLLQNGNLATAIIGVEGLDLKTFEVDSFELILGLVDLDQVAVDFITLVSIQDQKAIGGFRVNKRFFESVRRVLDGREFELSPLDNVLPIIPNEELIDVLDGISLNKIKFTEANDAFAKVMFDLWKLCESRNRLNQDNNFESAWLQDVEIEYEQKVIAGWAKVKGALSIDEINNVYPIIEGVIKKKISLSSDEIVGMLNERMEYSLSENYNI